MKGNGLNPGTISYTVIVYGFCKTGYVKEVWGFYKEMLQRDLLPSVVTYTCLIDGYSKKGQMDIANMLNNMRRPNIAPAVVTYNVLIAGYRTLGYSDRAYEGFEEKTKEGISPEKIMFKTPGLDKDA
ncbi:hypothetical protein LguiA_004771 [Lonicera macranthoides]